MRIHEDVLSNVAGHLCSAEQLRQGDASMQVEAQLERFLEASCKVSVQLHVDHETLQPVLHLHQRPRKSVHVSRSLPNCPLGRLPHLLPFRLQEAYTRTPHRCLLQRHFPLTTEAVHLCGGMLSL